MTLTARTINPYVAGMKRRELTMTEAERITGGGIFDVCTHPRKYKTGNYKKTKIEFFWWVSNEFYCPDCGFKNWQGHIEF